MTDATIPASRIRSILLGPDGEGCEQISRLSWLRSMIQVSMDLEIDPDDGVAEIEIDDPDAHAMMCREVTDLLDALQALIVETTVHQSSEEFLAAI